MLINWYRIAHWLWSHHTRLFHLTLALFVNCLNMLHLPEASFYGIKEMASLMML